VLVDGSVTREWAEHHHPNWYRALLVEEKVATTEERSPRPTDTSDDGKDA
jgi:cytochrome b subunit of formate dehydrogenase